MLICWYVIVYIYSGFHVINNVLTNVQQQSFVSCYLDEVNEGHVGVDVPYDFL